MKTVVLGGYGNFGLRICRALSGQAAIELVVAARDGRRAGRVAAALGAKAEAIDAAASDLARRLREIGADLVVHTAGPFQQQGYTVALACAEAGAHYIDLADGRRFVCDFAARLDVPFRAAGRVAISGASTVPALSSAVVDALRSRFSRLDAIDCCIAPAQQAPRGEATLAGVLSYCGLAIPVWRDGRWATLHGWADLEPVRFARMRSRLGALCDIPDLELFVQRYAGVRDVMFRAALEVGLAQRGFAALAWLGRRGWLARPQALAPWLLRVGTVLDRWGSALGGMVLRLRGLDGDGRPLRLAWHITADGNHGPEIPCMPAILLARRLARGEDPSSGARPCVGLLALHDFEPEFRRWGMQVDLVEEDADATS